MHLRQRSAEYQLSHYAPNGAQYVRHRDAFPDDGSEEQQRRVCALPNMICRGCTLTSAESCRSSQSPPSRATIRHSIAWVAAQVTAILYANPTWCPADGGKLRLWPPRALEPSPSQSSARAGAPAGADPTVACTGLYLWKLDLQTHAGKQ